MTTPTRVLIDVESMAAPPKNGYCRGMDKRLLDILCCPVSKTPLRLLHHNELEQINRAIAEHGVDTVDGVRVAMALDAGLITTDGKVIYRIEDDIPVLLPEEGIGTVQLNEFHAASHN